MTETVAGVGQSYTYDQTGEAEGPGALLNLLLEYREAERALRNRVATRLGVGDSDLLALRYLIRADREGRSLRPSDLRNLLGLTTAATTSLLDRLEERGYVRREPNPNDRRSSILVFDDGSTTAVNDAVDAMQSSILDVAEDLTDEQRATAIHLLHALIDATNRSNPSDA